MSPRSRFLGVNAQGGGKWHMDESEPEIVEIKDGWAAVGVGWAVFGKSQTEARTKYSEAQRRHREIRERALATDESVDRTSFDRSEGEP